jgi:hypothetical protein
VATALVQPAQTAEDEPAVHPSLQQYIDALPDSHKTYSRFFSALLIPTDSHPQFFIDLRHFREQSSIIYLLAPGSSEAYRDVTRSFVGSRFAHPWCRVKSDFGDGWRKASWVGPSKVGKKEREKVRKEEDRLHGLLVPIWIAMRRRMFPGDEIVLTWAAEEERKAAEREEQRKAARVEASSGIDSNASPKPDSSPSATYPELRFAMAHSPSASTPSAAAREPAPAEVEAASRMFVGATVAAFVMSDKRVKKYVQKKLLKK